MERAATTDQESPGTRAGSFRSILVATDLSEGSDLLIHTAVQIAKRCGAAVRVVHSADLLAAAPAGMGGDFEERVARARRAVEAQVQRVAPSMERMEIHVGASAPEITIMEQAQTVGADLIVLGPHVRRAGSGFLGTTAERVLSGAGAPCLVVRAPLSAHVPHVTAAVDPAHRLDSVLDAALRWSLLFGGDAGHPSRFSALYVTGDRGQEPPETLVDAVRDALERAGAGGRVDATVAVRGTDVVGSILLYAEAEVADLLVMSTRNRGMLGRALLGSVSAEVTRRAPCNVLLVPPGSGS